MFCMAVQWAQGRVQESEGFCEGKGVNAGSALSNCKVVGMFDKWRNLHVAPTCTLSCYGSSRATMQHVPLYFIGKLFMRPDVPCMICMLPCGWLCLLSDVAFPASCAVGRQLWLKHVVGASFVAQTCSRGFICGSNM